MSFQVKVGPGAWDAVGYVRNKLEDTDVNNQVIPDSAFQSYHTEVARNYSRFRPMVDQIGEPYTNSSPLVTVSGQRRYLCNAANGFTRSQPIARITEVLYRPAGGYSAAVEMGYFALLPFSPVNAFIMDPGIMDEPSLRYLRDKMLNELDHYGRGNAETGIDPSGSIYIDLYPTPVTASLPVFVRYHLNHVATFDFGQNAIYSTVQDADATLFGKLLLAEVMEQEADRVAKLVQATAGHLKVTADPITVAENGRRIKEDAELQLGGSLPVFEASI